MARTAAFVDMTDVRIGLVVITARIPDRAKHAWWFCRCDCGATFERLGIYLREAQKRGYRLACRACIGVLPPTCSICNASTHTRRQCPRRVPSTKYCAECMNLPHRRPRRGTCDCGLRYAPEPAVKRPDAYDQSPNARIL